MKCSKCGHKLNVVFGVEEKTRGSFEINKANYICENCGLVKSKPINSDLQIKRIKKDDILRNYIKSGLWLKKKNAFKHKSQFFAQEFLTYS